MESKVEGFASGHRNMCQNLGFSLFRIGIFGDFGEFNSSSLDMACFPGSDHLTMHQC